MRAIVVGTGAGGATAARELVNAGFEVIILEAGKEFKPFRRLLQVAGPLRRTGLLGNEKTITRMFPPMDTMRSSDDLVLVRGMTTGGSTVLSCGNIVRADHGLKEIGLDLSPEFEKIEKDIGVTEFPRKRWQPVTEKMFEAAQKLGLEPKATPKAVDSIKCVSCGLCELGCTTGARWDSRRFLNDAVDAGAKLYTSSPVKKVIIEKGQAKGVIVGSKAIKSDIVVLAAGGIGTAQILKASSLPAKDNLWVDIVLTLGGVLKGGNQIKEPPMVWYTKHEDYILSPYLDILSHWFHKPWRNVSIEDRVGVMVKLADIEEGAVFADGKVHKTIKKEDYARLDDAIGEAKKIMEYAGVSGPYVNGVHNGGHLGGTAPLTKDDVDLMKPSWLSEGLWAADLSLAPRSQGLPTILLASAMACRVAGKISEKYGINK
ncbi:MULTISPECIES: GMC family oxidoreductase N-terminal domain-containing protein [Methanobacterium]|jgi:choline dehydrogenase-like flavoprotein|uniref:GMC family oxidoreductase N-terminal domain-containing protein n=1 Tax=Methanobacterium veterum TaxID=408577 RepID=A0A9E5DLB0_9EURY|nr:MULTISPECIES: GMC family oxidoreductase N-terminal domain-containing protein [Methanobacterium]MCZ3366072.1 GMC family oxidoreductase N-terminal domain-containing protein [Methanobacterium veterum]MCZ3371700.1 GMC family oxidoreductase N-terminal domain-containing protein [Methanobacterium veterum]